MQCAHGDDVVVAVFNTQMGARLDSERRGYPTRVIGPMVVQQPKAAEIQAKIEQLQRALVKQLEKEQDHV
jgi:hypothetical protein